MPKYNEPVCKCGEKMHYDGGRFYNCYNVECTINERADEPEVRTFDTGATRDTDEGKHDVEAFYNPLVEVCMAEYMHEHRKQSDGALRAGDNWQKGIPFKESLKSFCRHVLDVRLLARGYRCVQSLETSLIKALCACRFNIDSMLLTLLQRQEVEEICAEVGITDIKPEVTK